MAITFDLSFKYDIKYKPSDTLYFGINLLLGHREFPLRNIGNGTGTASGDFSPLSSRTFNFTNVTSQSASFNDRNIIDFDGINDVVLETLFSDNNPSKSSFKVGSVSLRQIVEFKSTGSLNDFFNTQFTEISEIKLNIQFDSSLTVKLVGSSKTLKLGKQYGEILPLQWES